MIKDQHQYLADTARHKAFSVCLFLTNNAPGVYEAWPKRFFKFFCKHDLKSLECSVKLRSSEMSACIEDFQTIFLASSEVHRTKMQERTHTDRMIITRPMHRTKIVILEKPVCLFNTYNILDDNVIGTSCQCIWYLFSDSNNDFTT
uniref:Uncharacterized protein n=1 Tax=Romanomermis culicivorax TaxID=13658 RepID=A0A915L9U7_ROMCU